MSLNFIVLRINITLIQKGVLKEPKLTVVQPLPLMDSIMSQKKALLESNE